MENVANFDQIIAGRLKELRTDQGLTLDALAELSGVSRAMISRVERAEASPTAALLARLCAALGVSLSVFFEGSAGTPSPLARRAEQPVWQDPESGYRRRVVSPPGMGARVDIVEVEFPPGAVVAFGDQPPGRNQSQHVWVFDGEMELTVGETVHRLRPGDCLFMRIDAVHGFRNPTDKPARYGVIIDLGSR
ncbi:helix-turn-helix domain-containing protein [Rhizobium halophytocola]|uniref:Transcriptional regulator with XRE-family HTH domain n=1 Tax=Rhizobium halophytocola TaxID=735519 RepID=A0ABS4E1I1_9HYPH|nr:helix-turn-helix domain-containing protein [Rhizobium halophytocola]MBP1851792.1 transcriptional regulator with XRE-family HTH domain [Rhizobium halophytocola]